MRHHVYCNVRATWDQVTQSLFLFWCPDLRKQLPVRGEERGGEGRGGEGRGGEERGGEERRGEERRGEERRGEERRGEERRGEERRGEERRGEERRGEERRGEERRGEERRGEERRGEERRGEETKRENCMLSESTRIVMFLGSSGATSIFPCLALRFELTVASNWWRRRHSFGQVFVAHGCLWLCSRFSKAQQYLAQLCVQQYQIDP